MNRIFTVASLSALLAFHSSAQIATTTSLVGTISDSTGKVIPGVRVTAVETGTGDTHPTTTNDQGFYSIEFIRVGTYNITAEAPGFQKVTKTGVQVEINQVVRADMTLSIGTISQAITVEAEVTAIKTDDATVSEVLGTRN